MFCAQYGYMLVMLLLASVASSHPLPRSYAQESQPDYWLYLSQIMAEPRLPQSQIGDVTTNLSSHSTIAAYDRLELTFDVQTVAKNPYLPYDEAPPPGVEPGTGVTVNALFTPDNWHTIYTQPAFYYQDFIHEVGEDEDWIYPTDEYSWKVRFAPDRPGAWAYRLTVRDANAVTESPVQAFTVLPSENPGFIRVSPADSRYFEFDNGRYFPALGFNMPYNSINWTDPVSDNKLNFDVLSNNGIQLVRFWLTHWSIFGSAWNPWIGQQNNYNGYIPETGLIPFGEASGEWSMKLAFPADAYFDQCRFLDAQLSKPAVKQETTYVIEARYWAENVDASCQDSNCGLSIQIGDSNCGEAERVSQGYGRDTHARWQTLSGRWSSGSFDYLPRLHLTLENINDGAAQPQILITEVSIREDLTPTDPTDSRYGPNIISKASADHHVFFDQRNSFAFDKIVELAEQQQIYLRPVILEKGDRIFNAYDDSGAIAEENPDNFYTHKIDTTKVHWLYRAWWRYLQARWGYSTSIHSWELLNEGDPWNERHYALADDFAKYMHQFEPNDHLASTSIWHSYPKDSFWDNPAYPHVDFVDIHQYFLEGQESDRHSLYTADDYHDMASITQKMSMALGAKMPDGVGKPLLRGEVGFHDATDRPSDVLLEDKDGVWLHNLIWGGINPGGLIESYWHVGIHIFQQDENGSYLFDYRPIYRTFFNFVNTMSLNNGNYQDIDASVSTDQLRAWGQKDVEHGCAHLWIQNKQHTWKNVVDNEPIAAISGSVTYDGLQPTKPYTIEWWDPYQPDPDLQIVSRESVAANEDGSITILVDDLSTDIAARITSEKGCR